MSNLEINISSDALAAALAPLLFAHPFEMAKCSYNVLDTVRDQPHEPGCLKRPYELGDAVPNGICPRCMADEALAQAKWIAERL